MKKIFFLIFGCILFYAGMVFEHRLNVLVLFTTIEENEITSELELNDSFVYPEEELSEKLIKYYEISEEDLFKVFYRFIYETIYGKRKHATEAYVETVAKSYLEQLFYVPHPELVFYNIAKAKRESHFDIKASPSTSSAAGLGQIIYRWHVDKLKQSYDWRPDAPITKNMLSTDFKASVDAQYIVFESYWRGNNFNYNKATDAYFGHSNSEAAKRTYKLNLLTEYNLLSQRFIRMIFTKEPKYKLLTLHKEEVVDEKVLKPEEVEEKLNGNCNNGVKEEVVSKDVTE